MKKNNYFVGVRFTSDKQLFNKLNSHPLSNSVLIRKALSQYFRSVESNDKLDIGVDQDLVSSLTDQISFLRGQVTFLQKENSFLALPWYKKVIYQLEGKKE